jgi:hypothetical protein
MVGTNAIVSCRVRHRAIVALRAGNERTTSVRGFVRADFVDIVLADLALVDLG